jgi:hypothetical protein
MDIVACGLHIGTTKLPGTALRIVPAGGVVGVGLGVAVGVAVGVSVGVGVGPGGVPVEDGVGVGVGVSGGVVVVGVAVGVTVLSPNTGTLAWAVQVKNRSPVGSLAVKVNS